MSENFLHRLHAQDNEPFELHYINTDGVKVVLGGCRILRQVRGHACGWSVDDDFDMTLIGQESKCTGCPNQLACLAPPPAPSSPLRLEGDMWFTTAGIHIRIGGEDKTL